jgi:hypothetical protein
MYENKKILIYNIVTTYIYRKHHLAYEDMHKMIRITSGDEELAW